MSRSEHGVVIDQATVMRGGRAVIDALTLVVPPGQSLAMIGSSGSGKSSLLAGLATALPLHAGDIRIDGHSVRSDAAAVRRRIGFVPTGITAWPQARADEFLEFFALEAGLRGKPLRMAVGRGLAMAGIDEPGTPIDRLPAGQAQRLLVARGLLHDPQVLLLDAPFMGLDPGERRDIEHLINDMQLGGRIVIAAIDDAAVPVCFTHLAAFAAGRLVAHGPAVRSAFEHNRPWIRRITCPAAAHQAAAVLRRLGIDATLIDDDMLDCRHDPDARPFGDLLAALVGAGIALESADFHPPWPAQLLEFIEAEERPV
jgi:ABC-type multidrug transport system ATPase subunit